VQRVVRRLVCRCLITRLVAMFIWFRLKDQLQSITYSINDLDVNVVDRKHEYSGWFRFYHVICSHFAIVCY